MAGKVVAGTFKFNNVSLPESENVEDQQVRTSDEVCSNATTQNFISFREDRESTPPKIRVWAKFLFVDEYQYLKDHATALNSVPHFTTITWTCRNYSVDKSTFSIVLLVLAIFGFSFFQTALLHSSNIWPISSYDSIKLFQNLEDSFGENHYKMISKLRKIVSSHDGKTVLALHFVGDLDEDMPKVRLSFIQTKFNQLIDTFSRIFSRQPIEFNNENIAAISKKLRSHQPVLTFVNLEASSSLYRLQDLLIHQHDEEPLYPTDNAILLLFSSIHDTPAGDHSWEAVCKKISNTKWIDLSGHKISATISILKDL
jgi:hypothetical protein